MSNWTLLSIALVLVWNVVVFKLRSDSNTIPSTSLPPKDIKFKSDLQHMTTQLLPALQQFAESTRAYGPPTANPALPHNTQPFEKQTIVLPIGPHDYDRFTNLFKSMIKFFDFSDVQEWIIVMPKRDSEYGQRIAELTRPQLGHLIRIIEDTEIVPDLGPLPTTNWMTQQIIKLGVGAFVQTKFFLVLDADLICFKPTSFRDLIINGRAVTNMYDSPYVVHVEGWWQSSQRVLNMTMDAPTYFGVTPCILATEIVHGVYSRLEAIHGKRWSEFLLQNVWTYTFTEYCIYAVYAVASGLFPRFHIATINGVYNSEKSMWWESDFERIDIPHMVQFGHLYPGHFIVMQSNTKIEASRVREKMGFIFDE